MKNRGELTIKLTLSEANGQPVLVFEAERVMGKEDWVLGEVVLDRQVLPFNCGPAAAFKAVSEFTHAVRQGGMIPAADAKAIEEGGENDD